MATLLRAKRCTWTPPLGGAEAILASPLSATLLPSRFGGYNAVSDARGLYSRDLRSGCFPAVKESEAQIQ